jgi:hypothetical protein
MRPKRLCFAGQSEKPATRNTRDIQLRRRNFLELLANWLKSLSLAQYPAVTHADPYAAHNLNTQLETNHGQQPLGPGCGG